MPYRDLTFSLSAQPGGARFRLARRGRAVTAAVPALRRVPAHLAGNVAVIHGASRRSRTSPLWPKTVFSAWAPEASGPEAPAGAAPFRRFAGREWRRSPHYPALLEYSGGFCALASRGGADGDIAIVSSGSPAAALSLDPGVRAALPANVASDIEGAALALRAALSRDLAGASPSRGAAAALGFVESGLGACIGGRGEMRDSCVWSFSLGRGEYAVAGFSAAGCTFTIRFPFLEPGRSYCAGWLDDGLEYYVKDGLEIRPNRVSPQTRAVVKAMPGGGFLCRLREVANARHTAEGRGPSQ